VADESKEELENKKQQARVEKDINSTLSARDQAYKDSVKYSGEALDISRQITEDVKDQLGMVKAKSEADKGVLSLARQLQKSAALVTTELGNQGMISKQLQSDQNLQNAILTEMAALTKDLSIEEQDRAKYITELLSSQEENYNKIKKLEEEMLLLTDEQKIAQQDKIKRLQDQNAISEESIKNATVEGSIVNENNVRRLVQLEQQNKLTQDLIELRNKELQVQRKIEDTMGVTGALIEGVGGIMQRLGMRSGIFASAMEDAKNAMHEVAEEAVRSGKEYNESAVKLKAMAAGAKKLGAGFAKALFDPLSIILKIADAFFKVDRAATDLQRLTGQNSTALGGMNSKLATTVDFLEVATELTKQTGMNAQNIFSAKVIAGAAELKNTMGLAADEAGGLATIAQTTSGNIDDVTASIVDTTSAFNKSNRSAVSQGQILRDVATAADGIKASFAGNPEALAKAASAARRLGMEIAQVDRIANSLMDFESSIEAELEAQLLTGKNINMAKARELALNNDLAGLGKELFKNSSDIAEFGKMNRIQQEAQAKALGMSRDELGKIAYQRALEKGMTEDQAAAAANVNAEDMKRLAVQDKIQMSLDKLAQAFAPMLDIAAALVDVISLILRPITIGVGYVMKFASAFSDFLTPNIESTDDAFTVFYKKIAAAFFALPKLIAGIGIIALGNSIKNFFSGKGLKFDLFTKLKDKFTGLADTAKEKGKDIAKDLAGDKGKTLKKDAQGKLRDSKGRFAKAPTSDKGKEVLDKTKGKEVLDKTKGADTSKLKDPATPGKNIKEFLTNLAEGLKAMGSTKVLGGALNLIPASIGFITFIPGMVGVKLMEYLDGAKVKENLTNLAEGLKTMGSTKVLGGALNLIAASAGFVAFIPGMVGVKLMEYLAGAKVKENLTSLADGLTSFSNTKITGGALNLIAASAGFVTFIPGMVGAKLLEYLAGAKVKENLTNLAEGLTSFSNTKITGGALNLIAASAGFIAFIPGMVGVKLLEYVNGDKIKTGLEGIATGLESMASLKTLAGAGVLALSALGFIAMLPALPAMALLGLVAPIAAGGLAALGPALGAFGAAATPAIPILLTFAALTLSVGAALMMAAPAFEAFGNIIEKAFTGIAGVITSASNGISTIFDSVTPQGILSLAALGPALISAGAGLTAFSISTLLAGPGLEKLERIAALSDPLSTVGASLTAMAAGIAAMSAAINSLETEKLEEIKDLITTTAFAAPMIAATGAITSLIQGVTGGEGDKSKSDPAMIEKLDAILAAIREGGDVYIDGNKAGQSLMLAANKSS